MKFTNLNLEYELYKTEIDQAMQSVIERSCFILGPEVKAFEQELSEYFSVPNAVGVSSGTDALLLSLMALGIGPGDEVITTPFTFIATAEVIAHVGAKPVFVDIDEQTYNIDVSKIPEAISAKTKAIIPVHLYGQAADMQALVKLAEQHQLKLIEDVAQAMGGEYQGQKLGTFGDIGCLSFFPTKNLGCFGDGGALICSDQHLAERLRSLRAHGSQKKYEHELLGHNSRLDALQAAVLRVKLKHFQKSLQSRRDIAQVYREGLNDLEPLIHLPQEMPGAGHSYGQFTVRSERRSELIAFLKEQDVPTAIHYPKALHLQPVFEYLGYKEGDFPCAEQASQEVFSLPMCAYMDVQDAQTVCQALQAYSAVPL